MGYVGPFHALKCCPQLNEWWWGGALRGSQAKVAGKSWGRGSQGVTPQAKTARPPGEGMELADQWVTP